MWKLGMTAGALAVVAGAGYMVKRASANASANAEHASASSMAATMPAATGGTTSGPAASASAATAGATSAFSMYGAAHMATTGGSAHSPTLAAAATITYDCGDVAKHVAVCMEGKPDPASVAHFEQQCRDEHWTQDFMGCLMNADDLIGAHLDCLKFAHEGMAAAPAAQPASLDDLSCAAVGAHVVTLIHPSETHSKLGAHLAAICDEGKWSESRRRCMLLATATDALDACDDSH